MHWKIWDGTTNPLLIFGDEIEVLEWISILIPHFLVNVIIIHAGKRGSCEFSYWKNIHNFYIKAKWCIYIRR